MGIGNLFKSSGSGGRSFPAGNARTFSVDPEKYGKLKNSWKRTLRHRNVKLARKSVIDHYYDLPIEPNTVLLCGLGRNVNGSLRYLLDVLNKDSRFEGFRIYVRTTAEQTDELVNQAIEAEGWSRTETVPKKYDMRMETCQYLLTESWFPYQYIKRPGQTIINIWHGTPLKHLGALISGDKCHVNAQVQKNFLSADYLLYPNDFTRDVMWRSYQITHLLSAKALMMGYPRTSGILKVTEDEQAALRAELAPAGGRIYAYMPTFREYLDDDEFIERTRPVLQYLDEHLEDTDILYVNLHHYHHRNNYLDVDSFRHIRKFPAEIDTYRLLSVTDALISDYSSIFFDFLITGKQVILYVEDLDEYLAHQGLNMDIRRLPLDLAFSREELLAALYKNDSTRPGGAQAAENDACAAGPDDKDDISGLYKYDSADNPEKFCGLFLGDESGLDLSPIPDADRPAVLFYSDGFISDCETDLIKSLAYSHAPYISQDRGSDDQNPDDPDAEAKCAPAGKPQNNYEVYVGCDQEITELHKDRAYPWLHDVNVVASLSGQPLSSVGTRVKELYLDGKITFGRAIRFLAHEYALSYRRMYGGAKIDMILVMDSADPETIIGMALSPVKHKVLCISKDAVQKLKEGDRYLRDAVRYTSDYYDFILTCGSENSAYVKPLLPIFRRKKFLSVDCLEELNEIISSMLHIQVIK